MLIIPALSFAQGKGNKNKNINPGKGKNERVIEKRAQSKKNISTQRNKNSFDRFVDRNNDGICDGRGKGLGFKSNNSTTRADSIKRKEN